MSISCTWSHLPGPADFLYTIVDDLIDGNTVLVGLPDATLPQFAVEIAEAVRRKRIGRWPPVRSVEARGRTPAQSVESRSGDVERPFLWVEATDKDTASKWTDYARRRFAGFDATPRVCIAMPIAHAEVYREDSGLRRRLWEDFVTASDSRVLIERWGRYFGSDPMHIALKSTLVAELTGSDLAWAEQLAHKSLRQILDPSKFSPDHIWAAQVSVLFPLIDRERRRLLEKYQNFWNLPHLRENGQEIRHRKKLEVGDLFTQVKYQRVEVTEADEERLDWLRLVRNLLAHHDIVLWGTLTSPVARQIVNFGE